jgi:hypothetical protein
MSSKITVYEPWWHLNNRFGPLKIIIILEVLWIVFFAALVIAFQTTGDAGELLRDGLIKIAFHAGSPYAVLNAIEHGEVKLAPFFWILFAVFTDLWSTMDVWVYVDSHTPVGLGSYLGALKGIVLVALVLSSLSAVFYMAVVWWQGRKQKQYKYTEFEQQEIRSVSQNARWVHPALRI